MAATIHTTVFFQDLARMSAPARVKRVRLFFRRLLNQYGANRSRVMQSLMDEAAKLPGDARRKYLEARTIAFEGFSRGEQMELFSTHRDLLLALPREQAEAEIRDLEALRAQMVPQHHAMLERFIHFLPTGEDPTGKAVAGADAPELRREREIREQDQRASGRS